MQIADKYSPQEIESKWYDYWMEHRLFHSEPDEREPYTIVIPPPNVTGMLHMGHMLNNTLQDVLVRRARMQGKNACWVPGTDHASIATEAKVVAKLKAEGIEKSSLSREEFLRHAWDWKEKYGGVILQQLRKLGASCDWERTCFTMDEARTESVLRVFCDLYEKGLIYRGVRMVNWDPSAQTALSDEEVVFKESHGKLYYLRYRVEGTDRTIIVATTRPETILGDTALCVNPDDERYAWLPEDARVIVPLVGRSVPVIRDTYVDIAFGTGALKVTPAHDVNDYMLGEKYGLESIDIFNDDGTINDKVGLYAGMERFALRKQIEKDLDAAGLLEKTEDYTNNVGYSERTGVAIEPKLSMQWFLSMEKLAGPATRAVLEDEIKLVPEKYKNTYRHWMENIKDWCISRQLWWGQRIPAWYLPQGGYVVALNADEALEKARAKSGDASLTLADLRQDEDVLDTWFSSWLWPISVFDGIRRPNNKDIEYYYPTNDLVTGPDIIFFWVARMIFSGMEQMKKEPFKTVFIHGLVRDDKGRKMSKSLGNGIDPLEMAEKYGADALRFNLITGNSPGNDMRFFVEKCEAMRNFANKIWNASRFVMMNLSIDKVELPEKLELEDKWVLSKLNTLIREVTDNMEAYELGVASAKIYDFIWDTYCDWYIELTKTRLNGEDAQAKQAAENVLCYVLLRILELLHPFMPFITEEIWQALPHEGRYLISAEWPEYQDALHFPEAEAAMEAVKDAISAIRARRAEMNVPPSRKAQVILVTAQPENYQLGAHFITRMAYASELTVLTAAPADLTGMVTVATHDATVYMPMAELVDIAKELERIATERKKAEENLQRIEAKLANESFTSRAPENVVNAEREKAEKARALIAKLDDSAAAMKL